MKYKIYKMYFKAGVRCGTGKTESNSIEMPSDIIFSSLINEAAKIDEKILKEALDFFKERKILLSDAFPFLGDEYLLPKPLISFDKNSGDSSEKKLYKKITHIPISYFSEYVKGNSDPQEILNKTENLGNTQIDTKIQKKLEGDNEIYNLSYFRFNKNNGLYFILGFEDEVCEKLFDDLIYSIAVTGIGGKKTSGLGKFQVVKKDLPREISNKINSEKAKMLLTSSMAREDELEKLDQDANYALIRRGGFIYSEDKEGSKNTVKRKRTMYFFKAGSIFNKKFEGDIFRVDDGFIHPVYRYGIPMWLEVWYENLWNYFRKLGSSLCR